MMEAMQNVNGLETQITNTEAELAKVENWNQALSQQLEEVKFELEGAQDRIDELHDAKKDMK